jgi:hypothetical protein
VRLVKLLGLATAVAMSATALIGPSSASAVTLCRANQNPCSIFLRYQEPTLEGSLVAETSSVIAATPQVTCGTSNVTIAAGGSGTNPLMGKLTGLMFGNCLGIKMEMCEQAPIGLSYEVAITAAGGGNGTVSVEAGEGAPRFKVYCAEQLLSCIFAANMEVMELALNGGNPATLVANEEPLTLQEGSPGCSETATWTATYSLTPTPLFVAASP